MPRRARIAFAGAVVAAAAMVVTWLLAHDVASLRHADADILSGFLALSRPRLNAITNPVANLCDPVPYVVLAAIPVAIALLRGRPRVAIAIAILLLGANESTELLKPLLTGARDPVPGVILSHSTFPSGHATACMSLAMAMVISVPARWRPVVGAAMAAFCVAIVYSFLELGWHYPSDVLGGFEMASTWALLVIGALSWYEARRPVAHRSASTRPSFSVAAALAPALTLITLAVAFAAVLTALRPHAVLHYAGEHPGFVVAATVIAALSFALASGLSLMLSGGTARGDALSGSGPAATAAPRSRWRHG